MLLVQRKYNESATVQFCLFDASNSKILIPSIVFTIGELKISKDGGGIVNTANLPTIVGSFYSLVLTAGELSARQIAVTIMNASAVHEIILIETYGNTNAMHCFNLDYDLSAHTEDLKVKSVSMLTTGTALSIKSTGTGAVPAIDIDGAEGIRINGDGVDGNGISVYSNNSALELSGVNQPSILVSSNNSNAIYCTSMDEACVYLDSYTGNVVLLENYMGNKEAVQIKSVDGDTIKLISENENALNCIGALDKKDIKARELTGGGSGDPVTLNDNDANATIISNSLLNKLVDGIPIQVILELILAMVNGKFLVDKDTGIVTFYKRDSSTILFRVHVTEFSRILLGGD